MSQALFFVVSHKIGKVDEVEKYKRDLERNHTQYKIVEQTEQPDGSIIVKVIKQYNSALVGDYLN